MFKAFFEAKKVLSVKRKTFQFGKDFFGSFDRVAGERMKIGDEKKFGIFLAPKMIRR
jgi:hypothetical protein